METLRNKNDIFVFFEVIEQLEPHKVLDIGMFLKRIGSISRKAMESEVPEEIILDGIDVCPEMDFPVWQNIYNHIWEKEAFEKEPNKEMYDLKILLRSKDVLERTSFKELVDLVPARYLLIDKWEPEWTRDFPNVRLIDLKVDEDIYYLLDFGG